jgi:signal transduction histidine kinase
VRVNFRHSEIEGCRFEPEIETAGYRIIQEALTNVARHAGAEEAVVVVSRSHERLHLEIEDRGRGFDAADERIGERSSGLAGMRERALLLGGDFTIESVAGAGTRLKAVLPLFHSTRLERRTTVHRSRPGKVRGRADEDSTEPKVA